LERFPNAQLDAGTQKAISGYSAADKRADLLDYTQDYAQEIKEAKQIKGDRYEISPEEERILAAAESGQAPTSFDEFQEMLKPPGYKPTTVQDIQQTMEALNLGGANIPDYFAEGAPGEVLGRDEARRAAELLLTSYGGTGGFPSQRDYNNVLDIWTDIISTRGVDAALQQFEQQTGVAPGLAANPGAYTYDTAKALANELYRMSDIPTSGINPQTGARYDQSLNSWVNKIRYDGLEEALADWNRVNNKSFNVDAFAPILEKEPERLEALQSKQINQFLDALEAPYTPVQQFQPQGIPQVQFARPQIQFAPQQQQPLYPQQPMPQGLPALITQPTGRPTLATRTQTVGVPPALLVPTEAPVLNPQTAYIGVPTATQAAPAGMKEGGLASAARQVASEGRRGDSMLVHMTPGEVAGLQSLAQMMGGSLTVNPDTGLPEANFFKKILPIVAAVAAPYLAPVAGALGVSAPLLVGGLAGAGSMLGGGSLKDGLTMGLTAGLSSSVTSGMMGADPLGVSGGESTFSLANTFGGAAPATKVAPGAGTVDVTGGSGVTADELLASSSGKGASPGLMTAEALQPPPVVQAGTQAAAKSSSLMDYALPGYLAMGTLGAVEQNKLAQEEMARIRAAEEDKKRRGLAAYERSGLRDIPLTGATGGIVAMAGGGMTYMEAGGTTGPTGAPRDVTGTGDGMSDSVPATIEGVQEARLADGEFVIPADVVADIGNGSSDAGSKKLYDMMDRIRKARHGTTEQPPEINAEALMPA
jgi:hypothetical protein